MTRRRAFKSERLRKGIYLLPNVFTTLNIFFGFFSVILSIRGEFVQPSIAIFLIGLTYILSGPYSVVRQHLGARNGGAEVFEPEYQETKTR